MPPKPPSSRPPLVPIAVTTMLAPWAEPRPDRYHKHRDNNQIGEKFANPVRSNGLRKIRKNREPDHDRGEPPHESEDPARRFPKDIGKQSAERHRPGCARKRHPERPPLVPTGECCRQGEEDNSPKPRPGTSEVESGSDSGQSRREKRGEDPPMSVGGHREGTIRHPLYRPPTQ